jgi:hypothetical protein
VFPQQSRNGLEGCASTAQRTNFLSQWDQQFEPLAPPWLKILSH